RYTTQGKAEYKQRKETIERQFGSAKEYHGLRYTNQRGRKKMDLKAVLTFACMNMKKLALMMDRKERDGGGDGPSFADLWKKYTKKRQTPRFIRSLSAV
ncbi:transposase, partial [Aedoeadaptatus coli]|uniref:transposase n=1 Tax=Aedoeadaptatus coli TaxID=2058292 RepID=UPI0019025CF2